MTTLTLIHNTNPKLVSGQFVAGQFVAGQFVADNSSRTFRRGQLVAKYDINVTGDL